MLNSKLICTELDADQAALLDGAATLADVKSEWQQHGFCLQEPHGCIAGCTGFQRIELDHCQTPGPLL